jgi:hypothetical protein
MHRGHEICTEKFVLADGHRVSAGEAQRAKISAEVA